MDITQISEKEKKARARKMMLWFGIVSLIMGFAGWTSAYIVSSSREDWLADFELPSAFLYSTLVILFSSLTYMLAQRAVKQDQPKMATNWLMATFVLGITFIVLQIFGFSQMVAQGYYFTGPTSNITVSFIYVIAAVHILHVLAGLVTVLVVLINQMKQKYTAGEMLGMEMGATFWHFVDLLWIYLVLFFYFY
ncbi:cytochrome c oxidase subunit 3 [Poritiphilus flavus]|uniref:Heme-copper oxidase subunit III n=1 Tax=Poritiphilus flavus TaxID=2697053 RepID=A0A6L9EGL5_9FLAO|nr:cytochrome c oxidase subunit 3 [Poritiphilus flavus]NAS13786.1 heme-copper oxidase subunit III [Poritiphilus flavus]